MNNDPAKCPSCGGVLTAQNRLCPHCGRWMMTRGISFYAFWTALSLVTIGLVGGIFYAAFLIASRVL